MTMRSRVDPCCTFF